MHTKYSPKGRCREAVRQVGSSLPFLVKLRRHLRPDHLLIDVRSVERVLSSRAVAVNRRIEIPVLVVALAVFPMLALEMAVAEGRLTVMALILEWLIWGALSLELTLIMILTDRRFAYLRKAWLYMLVVVVAFPPLSDLMGGGLLAGTFRPIRVVVLIALFIHSSITLSTVLKHILFEMLAIARHPWLFAARPLLNWHGLGLVSIAFVLLTTLAGTLHATFEGHAVLDGLWWALVTLTTVGYGDIAPVTLGGRITASMLMLAGVGVLAAVTASIAARYVEGDHRKELHKEVTSLHERLDRIESLLTQDSRRSNNDPPQPKARDIP